MTRHSLKYRLLLSLTLATCLTALLFGMVSFLFAYNIEDSFFERILEDEAMRVSQTSNSAPHLPFVTLYTDIHQLPDALQSVLAAEPQRKEIGVDDGRHFHLKRLDDGRLLVAEVSDYLIVRKIKGGMLKFLLICLSLVLLLALLLALSIANRLLKPLFRLTQVIETATESGLPKGFANAYPNNEIGILAQALDTQMQRIDAFIQREQQFTRDVSHELRTPLTVFCGALTLLNQTQLDHRQVELVTRLNNSSEKMQCCLQGLLALAREENLVPVQLNLRFAIEQALLPHLQHLTEQDRLVSVEVDGQFTVTLPSAVLDAVLSNLIGNAVSHGHGELRIELRDRQLLIVNQGPMLSAELRDTLFDSGTKGPDSQGLGMGLSIVKRLCDSYQVHFEFRSDKQNNSAVLVF